MDSFTDPMQRALELARSAIGISSPNPPVGAVLVKDGVIVGTGSTQPPGMAHAEVIAIEEAGSKAHGSTMHVTLEPCPHQGQTPPCANAIIAAGITEVHIASMDPNPAVAGRGKAALELAGIGVIIAKPESSEAHDASQLIEAFTKYITTNLPFVTAKFAMSLDGKFATSKGHSQWISGIDSRLEAHRLRARSDAVMVGIGTAKADNPRLTARLNKETIHSRSLHSPLRDVPYRHQPLRVVVDSRGRLSPQASMLAEPGPTLVVIADVLGDRHSPLIAAKAEVVSIPDGNGRVSLLELLSYLSGRGITSVIVEGGTTLLGSIFDEGLVDKVVAFIAPIIIGGEGALSPIGGHGFSSVAEALQLRRVQYEQSGLDMMVVGYPSGNDVHRRQGQHP